MLGSLQDGFEARVGERFARHPLAPPVPLDQAALAHLPPPVQRYLHLAGAVGRPRIRNVRVEWAATMFRKPGAPPLPCRAVQFGFVDDPARHFYLRSRMFGLPVKVLHGYQDAQATMQVRVAGIFPMVNLSGPVLDQAETVTILNDLCVLAPSALAGPAFGWTPVDDRACAVRFRNGPHQVSARLRFDAEGALVDFVSEDRAALQPDGSLRRFPWSTPLSDYRDFGGRRVASRGETIYQYAEGPFTYGTFEIRSLAYDVAGPGPA